MAADALLDAAREAKARLLKAVGSAAIEEAEKHVSAVPEPTPLTPEEMRYLADWYDSLPDPASVNKQQAEELLAQMPAAIAGERAMRVRARAGSRCPSGRMHMMPRAQRARDERARAHDLPSSRGR